MLLLRINDPDRLRNLRDIADTAEVLLQLVLLTREHKQLLLGETGAGNLVKVHGLELLEPGNALRDGLEISEHSPKPTLVDIGHANASGLLNDGLLGLLLRADEKNLATLGDSLLDEGICLVNVGQRLVQVNDVDAVTLGEDETLHLRVPATRLMSEVDAALEELASGDDGHAVSFPLWAHHTDMPNG